MGIVEVAYGSRDSEYCTPGTPRKMEKRILAKTGEVCRGCI